MSTVVARRLEEMARRAQERRQRVSEIRRQSRLLVDAVQQLRLQGEPQSGWGIPGSTTSSGRLGTRNEKNPTESETSRPPHDILGQVKQLLVEMDGLASEHWTEDDTLVLICLQGALAAALRKGYAFLDVQTILNALRPPGMEE